MYAVIRNYSGNPGLADQLAARADEVKGIVSGISGFRGYYLLRTENGASDWQETKKAPGLTRAVLPLAPRTILGSCRRALRCGGCP